MVICQVYHGRSCSNSKIGGKFAVSMYFSEADSRPKRGMFIFFAGWMEPVLLRESMRNKTTHVCYAPFKTSCGLAQRLAGAFALPKTHYLFRVRTDFRWFATLDLRFKSHLALPWIRSKRVTILAMRIQMHLRSVAKQLFISSA